MLSIIICSRSPKINAELEENIKTSVGLPYELIVIDNSENKYSIFSAYNVGMEKAVFPFLCFVHEDVLFKTNNWGSLICKHLRNPNIGILGVAGGDLITKIPSSWSEHKAAANYIQFDKKTKKSKLIYYNKQCVENLHEVVLLDGFFLCTTSDFLKKVKFDEETFKGFHFYDIDICLQSKLAGYKNYVVFDVLIEHFSSGFKSKDWIKEWFKLEEKWKNHLPIMSSPYSSEQIEQIQEKSFFRLVKRMLKVKMPLSEVIEKSSVILNEIFPVKSKKHLIFWIYKTKFLLFFGIS
jgi:GT2 family glycosyltransferase